MTLLGVIFILRKLPKDGEIESNGAAENFFK